MFIKIFVSRILQLSLFGKIIRIIFNNKIPFYGSLIYTNSNLIKNSIISALFFKMYESAEVRLVKKYLSPDLPIIELGSSIGVMATQLGKISNSKIVCVEANPDLLPIIENNLQKNKIKNYKIISKALSYNNDFAYFIKGDSNISGQISTEKMENSILIPSTTLGKIIKEEALEEYALICDIEGFEIALFLEDPEAFNNCKQLIIETHEIDYKGKKYNSESIKSIILGLGFKTIDTYGPCFYFKK